MRDHFRWGDTFQEIINEFTTEQLTKLRKHCRQLIASAGASDQELSVLYNAYKLVLCRVAARKWSLERGEFPPHWPPGGDGKGGRIRAARRVREKKERKENAVAARPRKPKQLIGSTRVLLSQLRSAALRSEFGHKLLTASAAFESVACHVEAQWRHVTTFMRQNTWGAGRNVEAFVQRTCCYVHTCVETRYREKRIETTPECASGMRLESRPFAIGRLKIQLNTWAPIDPGFDKIWDSSLFGVRLLEGENL